jgi:anti-sigma-K factor RskA
MNLVELQKKLIAAARANAPGDHVPYAFEKRVMALLASRVAPQNMDWWVRGFWRAAVSCVAVALLCGAWAVFTPTIAPANATTSTDLSQDFENTLLASVDQGNQAP